MKVTLLMALTADGKIARSDTHLTDWTEREDKRLFKTVTKAAGVVIMGSKTYATLKNPLVDRKTVVMTRRRSRRSTQPNVVFSTQAPRQLIDRLQQEGFTQAIVTGGATINTLFARAGLIDEMVLTYSPRIFGSGLALFAESLDMALKLEDVKSMGTGLIYARYSVVSQAGPPESPFS